jgi:hypothetical protein
MVVEKPCGSSFEECKRIVDMCARADVPLLVNYIRRFTRLFDLLPSGRDVYHTVVRCSNGTDGLGFMHWLDLTRAMGYMHKRTTLDLLDYQVGEMDIYTGQHVWRVRNGGDRLLRACVVGTQWAGVDGLGRDAEVATGLLHGHMARLVDNATGVLADLERPRCTGIDALIAWEGV